MWSVFCSIKRSWTQHFVTQFSAFLVMTLTYSAAIFVAFAVVNMESLLNWWGQVNKVTVYLKHGTKEGESKKIESYVQGLDLVKEYKKVNSKESSERFKERFSKIANQKINLDKIDNFFPEFYELSLTQSLAYHADKNVLSTFVTNIKAKFPQIQDVSFGQQWLEKYISILSSFKMIAWLLIGLFVLASLIASSSVIKTLLFSRRDEIEILEFIGASEFRIYLPQMANILLVSSAAFVLSVGLNYIFYLQMNTPNIPILQTPVGEKLEFVSIAMILLLFLFSFFSNILYSLFTIFNLMPSRKKALVINEVFQK